MSVEGIQICVDGVALAVMGSAMHAAAQAVSSRRAFMGELLSGEVHDRRTRDADSRVPRCDSVSEY